MLFKFYEASGKKLSLKLSSLNVFAYKVLQLTADLVRKKLI